jgi:TetR/AcrR family transcriptional repressor of nem operon
LRDYAEAYLSDQHREHVGEGCPYAALTADLARSGDVVREVATQGLKRNYETMAARMPFSDPAEARRYAILVSSLMTGAVGLARVSKDDTLSEEILTTVKGFVEDLAKRGEK